MNQLLVSLRLYSTGGHLQSIADFSGMHLSTVSRIVKRVSEAIARLYPRYIKFPNTEIEIKQSQQQFYSVASFPRVVGAIDCTHMKIQSPGDNGYFNNNYLLTPLLQPRTAGEQLYNESHIRTRNCIERCFGVWKRRFPILAYGCRLNINTYLSVVVATGVIHNIAIDMGDVEAPPLPEELQNNILNQLIENGEVPIIMRPNDIESTRLQYINWFTNL
ncbi:hypothetical protein FQR65_LT14436 [Abscondita terminalis]|nr:hypothetical protein FQR65_LT14436 [Abscondita terminalis]